MSQFHQWYQEQRVERTIQALKRNHFEAQYFATAAAALDELWKAIPEGASVGIGGSLSLTQIGFFEEAAKRGVKLVNPFSRSLSAEEADRIRRAAASADVFLTSSNAITEDGKLYNIDATGNRVAPMIFGPRKVILICGVNKIVKDLNEAERKVQHETAVMNAKRLGSKTPCAETGECSDCNSPGRICGVHTIMVKKPRRTDFRIFLVGEFLGL